MASSMWIYCRGCKGSSRISFGRCPAIRTRTHWGTRSWLTPSTRFSKTSSIARIVLRSTLASGLDALQFSSLFCLFRRLFRRSPSDTVALPRLANHRRRRDLLRLLECRLCWLAVFPHASGLRRRAVDERSGAGHRPPDAVVAKRRRPARAAVLLQIHQFPLQEHHCAGF